MTALSMTRRILLLYYEGSQVGLMTVKTLCSSVLYRSVADMRGHKWKLMQRSNRITVMDVQKYNWYRLGNLPLMKENNWKLINCMWCVRVMPFSEKGKPTANNYGLDTMCKIMYSSSIYQTTKEKINLHANKSTYMRISQPTCEWLYVQGGPDNVYPEK